MRDIYDITAQHTPLLVGKKICCACGWASNDKDTLAFTEQWAAHIRANEQLTAAVALERAAQLKPPTNITQEPGEKNEGYRLGWKDAWGWYRADIRSLSAGNALDLEREKARLEEARLWQRAISDPRQDKASQEWAIERISLLESKENNYESRRR